MWHDRRYYGHKLIRPQDNDVRSASKIDKNNSVTKKERVFIQTIDEAHTAVEPIGSWSSIIVHIYIVHAWCPRHGRLHGRIVWSWTLIDEIFI